MKIIRGKYGEINILSLNERTRSAVSNLFNEAKNSDKVDEHGNWEFGAEFDKAGRGYAINWDLYGISRDFFSKKLLIVIQIRKWEKRTRRGYANIQKSYFLLGRNEDNTAFAHPVESRVVHHAIRFERDVCRACQDWMFKCDYKRVIRQGDIAMIPMKSATHAKKAASVDTNEVIIENSHKLIAEIINQNGDLYAKNPSLYHLPGTHPHFENLKGWYKVVVSRRGRFHDFATPTID